jgi:DNA-binding MarR family transcriptional regulator
MNDALPERPLLGLLLRLLNQHYNTDVHQALQAHGFGDIGASHSNVFVFVPAEGIPISELARLAQVRRQSMTQAVRELVSAGYAELRDNPADRRSKLVFLTQRGQAVGPVAVEAGRRVEERWAGLTSPEQVESLRAALTELLLRLHTGADGIVETSQ